MVVVNQPDELGVGEPVKRPANRLDAGAEIAREIVTGDLQGHDGAPSRASQRTNYPLNSRECNEQEGGNSLLRRLATENEPPGPCLGEIVKRDQKHLILEFGSDCPRALEGTPITYAKLDVRGRFYGAIEALRVRASEEFLRGGRSRRSAHGHLAPF